MTDELVAEFRRYLENRQQSPATIRNRVSYVSRLLADVDPYTVRAWPLEEWVHSHGWKPQSINGAVTAIRKFFQWLQRSERRADDPTIDLKTVPLRHRMGRVATDEQITAALAKARPPVQMMILLAAECGLRRAEIAKVHRDDIEGDRLRVIGKGDRERFVYLSQRAQQILTRLPATGYIFPRRVAPPTPTHGTYAMFQRGCHDIDACPGHPDTGRTCREANRDAQARSRHGIRQVQLVDRDRPMSPDSIAAAIRTAFDGNPHSLRHRAATAVYRGSGNDIRLAQEFLGHASPAMTARYVHVDERDLRTAALAATIPEKIA